MPAKPDKPPVILDELKLQMDDVLRLPPLPPPDRSTATEMQLRMSFAAVQAKSIASKTEKAIMAKALEAMEDFNNAKAMPEWRPRDPTKPKGSIVHIRRPPKFSKP